ncbi:DnaT-like ssDNA-binding protein [Cronobacter sakazakii]
MIDNNPSSPGFNSYGDVAGLMAFASSRGYDVPEESAEMLLFQAIDYLNLQPWAGKPAKPGQALPWPRSGVTVGGEPFPDDEIPQALIQAQYRLAVSAQEIDLMPGCGGAQALEETVSGVVSIKYSEQTLGATVYFPWLRQMLGDVLGAGASSVNFRVMRD